jgi:hypothetical protein
LISKRRADCAPPLIADVRAHMTRPRPVETLGRLLTWLGISGVGGGVLFLQDESLPVAPSDLLFGPALTVRLIGAAAGFYALTALVAAYAVLKMRPWARHAYIALAVSIAYYVAQFSLLIKIDSPWPLGIAFFAMLIAFLLWGWNIVRRHIPRETANAL